MGLVSYGFGVDQISGKVGGGVFAKNAGGDYVRQNAIPINPQSAPQMQQRSTMSTNSQAWRALSDAQRAGWTALGKQISLSNRVGKKYHLSGISIYTRLNNNLVKIGIARLDDAPGYSSAEALLSLTLIADSAGPTLTLGFSPTPIPANTKMYLEATPQLSPGIEFVKNRYRKIAVLPAATATAHDIHADYIAVFGEIISGQKMFIRAKFVSSDDGFESLPLTFGTIVS